MKFEEAMKHLREGKAVWRPSWLHRQAMCIITTRTHVGEVQSLIIFPAIDDSEFDSGIDLIELLADDWEVLEAEPKIKQMDIRGSGIKLLVDRP